MHAEHVPVLQDSICDLSGTPLIHRLALQNRRRGSHLQRHLAQRQRLAGGTAQAVH